MTLERPDYSGAIVTPSPNFGARRGGREPDMLLLHYTGMSSGQGALDWLRSPQSEVSSHYVVLEDGTIHQLVCEDLRAWHAGRSFWRGETDINSCSIGIEIANPGHDGGYPDFPDAQTDAVVDLCRDCIARRGIAPERVLAHSDVAPSRKCDPGEKFPWARLHASGVGHWVAPSETRSGRYLQQGESGQPIEALQSLLALYGYQVEVSGCFDAATSAAVSAFQRHFRPARIDGVADVSTIETLHRLLAALPQYN